MIGEDHSQILSTKIPPRVECLLNANGNLQELLGAMVGPIKLTVHQHELIQGIWHRHISVSLQADPSQVLYEAHSQVHALEGEFSRLLGQLNLGQLFKLPAYSEPNFHLRKVYFDELAGFGREYRLWRDNLYDCHIQEDYSPFCLRLIRESKLA